MTTRKSTISLKKHLLSLSKPALVAECKKYELSMYGTKQEMVERILTRRKSTTNGTILIEHKSWSRMGDTSEWLVGVGEYNNDLIPKSLQNKLKSEVESLMSNKNKFDYRNTDLMNTKELRNIEIQDIIEPCNVQTIKTMFDSNHISLNDHANSTDYGFMTELRFHRKNPQKPTTDHLHSYIPSVFRLNEETNKYEIISEIVDLPKTEKNIKMYEIIETIFNLLTPYIHRCMKVYPVASTEIKGSRGHIGHMYGYGFNNTNINKQQIQKNDQVCEIENKIENNYIPEYGGIEEDDSIANEYYVVVKMSDYQFLDPQNSVYGGGKFHSEGLDKDQIRGVALYYFDISDNVNGGGLTFHDTFKNMFGSSTATDVDITDNLCVCFGKYGQSHLEHKVNAMNINGKISNEKVMYNKNRNNVYGTRKFLGFFICNKYKMKTTQNVIVNLRDKFELFVNYFMKDIEIDTQKVCKYVIDIMCLYTFGDMKYIKEISDNVRRERYEYDQNVANYEKRKELREQRYGGMRCD